MKTTYSSSALLLTAIAFAVLFLGLFIPFHPYTGSFIIKAIPVLCCIVAVMANMRGYRGLLLVSGLFFSVIGDIVLDLDRSRFFIIGLISFLIAHIFYAFLFIRKVSFSKKSWPIISGISLYSIILALFLRNMDASRLPAVLIYLLTISVMAIFAGVQMTHHRHERWSVLVFVGALVFMLSDTIIAVNQFLYPITNSLMYSLPCYWTAQLLIVRGMLNSDKK